MAREREAWGGARGGGFIGLKHHIQIPLFPNIKQYVNYSGNEIKKKKSSSPSTLAKDTGNYKGMSLFLSKPHQWTIRSTSKLVGKVNATKPPKRCLGTH